MDGGLIIDSFAGGGGASTGIEWALGRSPDFAINHDPEALAMHQANHPDSVHLTENIWKVDPAAVTKGRPVFLLWASPDCRHHSKAKGGKPVSRSVRGLADVVILWAKVAKPQIIALENVEEFQDWGPLTEEGRPCPTGKGLEFHRWVRALEGEGYAVDWREQRASWFGAPTIRKRLFVIARRDSKPILWPAQGFAPPEIAAASGGALKPFRTAAHDVVDWSIRAPSIFLTRAEAKEHGLNIVRPLARKSMARLARGFKRHVLDRADPFLVFCGQPSAPFLGVNRFENDGRAADAPMPTITANSFIKRPGAGGPLSVVSPFLSYAQQGGGNRDADAPVHTVCASTKDQNQVVTGFLVPRYGERPGQEPRSVSAEGPMPVVVPTGNGGSLAAVYIAQQNTDMVGHDADKPLSTIVQKGCTQTPVFAYLSTLQNNTVRGDVREPVGTVLSRGNHHAITTPFLAEMRGRSDARDVDEALSTVTQKATHGVVAPFLTSYYSEGSQDAAADVPLPTVPTRARFSPTLPALALPPLTAEMAERARMVAAFLREFEVWDGPGEFVTIGDFIVWDIGMRMLTPRELARAQGFPDSYILAAPLPGGGVLTETAQRHKIGNSVCPQVAEAIVRANCIDALNLPNVRRKLAPLPDRLRPRVVSDPGLFEEIAA